jgi:hypothetical protein
LLNRSGNLSFTLASGVSRTAFNVIVVGIPRGLSFSASSRRLADGIRITGAGETPLRFRAAAKRRQAQDRPHDSGNTGSGHDRNPRDVGHQESRDETQAKEDHFPPREPGVDRLEPHNHPTQTEPEGNVAASAKTHINRDNLRRAIILVVNATLVARDRG